MSQSVTDSEAVPFSALVSLPEMEIITTTALYFLLLLKFINHKMLYLNLIILGIIVNFVLLLISNIFADKRAT